MAVPLYRSEPPQYKGCDPTLSKNPGGLSGLFCNLFGTVTPEYKCSGASTDGARCWFQLFPGTPEYKGAPKALDPAPGDGSECDCPPHTIPRCEDVVCIDDGGDYPGRSND